MEEKATRYLARVRTGYDPPDVVIEDHGLLILNLNFQYEGGSVQGMPLILEGANGGKTLKAIMRAIGVDSLRKMGDKSCWVTATHSQILKIEPLHAEDGTPWTYYDSAR